jgi:hypothetical protein
MFSVLSHGPLVSQEGPSIMNLIPSKIMKSVWKKSCMEQLFWVRCNEKQLFQGGHTLFRAWCCTVVTWKIRLFFQNSANSENVLVGPYGETYPASHDASQAMNIKTEEVSDEQEDADPLQITFQEMKAEPEVSCMFLYVHCYADVTNMQKCHLCVSCASVCRYMDMKQLHCAANWPLKTYFWSVCRQL